MAPVAAGPYRLASPAVEGEAVPHLPVPALLGLEAVAWQGSFPGETVLGFLPLPGLDVDPVVWGDAARVICGIRISRRRKGGEAEVRAHPIFQLGRYRLVVAEVGGVFDSLRVRVYFDQTPPVVDPDYLGRHQGGVGPEKAHLYPDVRDRVPLVEEDVVNPADPLVVHVVDAVLLGAFLEPRERVRSDSSVHSSSFHETIACSLGRPRILPTILTAQSVFSLRLLAFWIVLRPAVNVAGSFDHAHTRDGGCRVGNVYR